MKQHKTSPAGKKQKNKPGQRPAFLVDKLAGLLDTHPMAALQSGKLMARAWIKTQTGKDLVIQAQAFVIHIIENYWQKVHEGHSPVPALPFLFKQVRHEKIDEAVLSVAGAIGAAAAKLSVLEAGYQLGNVYTALLPDAERAGKGIFYTPPSLTSRLIAMAGEAGVDWASARVIDPACGGGAFLAPVALKMISALGPLSPDALLNHVQDHLFGWEIDPFGGWLTQVFVEAALKDTIHAAGFRPQRLVRIVNSLDSDPLPEADRFDLVIGNPPYGKLTLSPEMKEKFAASLFGHPNYYGLFTHLALDLARGGGVIALLTPTSFLSGEYFKNLRVYLRLHARPVEIDFVSFRKGVFEDVLQETMLATYQKQAGPGAGLRVNQLDPETETDTPNQPAGVYPLPEDITAPWILPRNPDQAAPVRAMQAMHCVLADWGYGVSTGPLVWNRYKKQLVGKKRKNSFPIIWAEAITIDGRFILRADKRNHRPYFVFWKGDDSLITRNPCILLQRTTAKEQSKRLIAAVLPEEVLARYGGVAVENHLNMIIPIIEAPAVGPAVLAAFLNSRAVNEAFRAMSGSVAVSAYELESLRLPAPELLKQLTQQLRDQGDPEGIEAECLRLYTPFHE
jgi:adenine-specific DNA-methyltransferase